MHPLFVVALAACTRHEPPGWDAAPGSLSVSPLPPLPPSPLASASPPASASPSASVDPATLPQTRDRPSATSPSLDARVATLWSAIVQDDPSLATPSFFPLAAYQQVKAIANPEADWNRRLVANYARDIHRLHERLGDKAAGARFESLEIPNERVRWVEPGEEFNKIGYYRVYGTKLRYSLDGNPAAFDVASLISWRGEWYVVHLSGFK